MPAPNALALKLASLNANGLLHPNPLCPYFTRVSRLCSPHLAVPSAGSAHEHEDVAHFVAAMQHRTLWLIGDSLSRQHYVSIKCRFWHLMGTPTESTPWPLEQRDVLCQLKAECFSHGPARVCLVQDPWLEGKAEGVDCAQPTALIHLLGNRTHAGLATHADHVVFNYGEIFVVSVERGAGRARRRIRSAYQIAHSIADLVYGLRNSSRCSHTPQLMWREVTPQHFFTADGLFKSSRIGFRNRRCRRTAPANVSLSNALNLGLNPIFESAGIPIMSVWQLAAQRGSEHPGVTSEQNVTLRTANGTKPKLFIDCTHFCEPSPFLAVLVDLALQLPQAQQPPRLKCGA